MPIHAILKSLVMIAVCIGVGAVISLFMQDSLDEWYLSLAQPPLTPPGWVFGVVWPMLYVMMGIAAGLIWSKPVGRSAARAAMQLFIVQLALNGFWTPLFFHLHRIDLALIEIGLLWLAILASGIAFFIQSKAAGLLLLPYWLWISFAVYLNAGYWLLNK